MGLTVHIKHSAEIDELINRFDCFKFLKGMFIPETESNVWNMNNTHWNLCEQKITQLQVIFIGKTGYGKSTTLNQLVGKSVFATDNIKSCTKDLYSAIYRLNNDDYSMLSLSDLPGIGEGVDADNNYYDWYRAMLKKSDCVVYVLRADQRDFSIDEKLFYELFHKEEQKNKVILAINFADSIEPINRKSFELTDIQIKNLKSKMDEVSRIFKVPLNNILYYSANENIHMQLLAEKIAYKLNLI